MATDDLLDEACERVRRILVDAHYTNSDLQIDRHVNDMAVEAVQGVKRLVLLGREVEQLLLQVSTPTEAEELFLRVAAKASRLNKHAQSLGN